MKRCLQLAGLGIGTTRPNPSVGAVVVHNEKIIGEGFTAAYGGAHAEVYAIGSVKDKSLLKEATLYVTLEPCSHHGKTPPCADLIVKEGIPRVVIGCLDTNSLVAGKGIERLKKAGCEVLVGVLEQACFYHHRRFFKVQNEQRPYVILKWAASSDGIIAPLKKEHRAPVWISNKHSQQLVHKWRSEEHAILVGTNTAVDDNPALNVRSWSGQHPVRVVIDRTQRIAKDSKLFDQTVKTIVLVDRNIVKENYQDGRVFVEPISFESSLAMEICKVLQRHKIQSVIIEGGRQTLTTFIKEGLWDEARIFTGSVALGTGIPAPEISGKGYRQELIKNDYLRIITND